jgi:hypothetical protein
MTSFEGNRGADLRYAHVRLERNVPDPLTATEVDTDLLVENKAREIAYQQAM